MRVHPPQILQKLEYYKDLEDDLQPRLKIEKFKKQDDDQVSELED